MDRFPDAIRQGEAALQKCAAEDGAYRLKGDREEVTWPTALVLFVRAVREYPTPDLQRIASRLLSVATGKPDDKQAAEVHDFDLSLTGWPWAEGNFSWVEPTAWACLALRRAGFGDHPRVQEGLKLLLDRALPEGGVNYGNRRIFGISLEPIPGPTALMLLALQGRNDDENVIKSVAYLQKQALSGDDLEHLCWARMALDIHRDHPGVADSLTALDERIRSAHAARFETPYVRPAPLREALTALAVGLEQGNPFRLNGETRREAPVAGKLTYQRLSFGERIRAKFQDLAVTAATALRPLDPRTDVHVAPVKEYNADLADVVKRQYEHFRAKVPLAGKRVVLKPNLVEYHRDKVINTNPHVVAAAIELCKKEGAAEVIVAEGPGHWRNVEYLVSASGLGDVLRHHQVPFTDLNHDEPVKTPNLGRLTRL